MVFYIISKTMCDLYIQITGLTYTIPEREDFMTPFETNYEKHRAVCFYAVIMLAAGLLILASLKLLFPFAIAWMLALLLQPTISWLTRKTGLKRGVISVAILLLLLLGGGSLLYYLGGRMILELKDFAGQLGGRADEIGAWFDELEKWLKDKLPLLGEIESDTLVGLGSGLLKDALTTLSAKLTSVAGGILMRLPHFFFVLVIFQMAAFYLCADFERVSRYLSSLLPMSAVRKLGKLKRVIFSTTLRYLRAYFILLIITFAELLTAFLLLGIDYALTLALLIALLDALPAIGVGTVLLPWALISLLLGNWQRALALVVIYAIVTVVRQIAEPHVVGAQLGLHPLASLVAVYAGYKLAGIWGLLFAPVAAILIRGVLDILRAFWQERDAIDHPQDKSQPNKPQSS